MKIKNIELLRDHILESLEKLAQNKIDVNEASTIAKNGEVIMSSVKLQMMYNNMRNEIPDIDFLQQCNDGKEIERPKAIAHIKQIK